MWHPSLALFTDLAFYHSLIVCALYYYLWAKWIPKWKGYKLRQELVDLGGGAEAHSIAKVPIGELAAWDATHDAVGRLRSDINVATAVSSNLSEDKLGNVSIQVDSKDERVVHTVLPV